MILENEIKEFIYDQGAIKAGFANNENIIRTTNDLKKK